MKTILFSATIIASFFFHAAAHNNTALPMRGHSGVLIHCDTAGTSSLSQWLGLYFGLKDALVTGDAASAANKAGALLKAIDNTDIKALSAEEQKALSVLQPKLDYDARHISEVQDIDHQREHFASLSLNMYKLAKTTRLSAQPIYKDYCPMRKAFWLSSDAAIRNPYFGSQMLTCGQVKETL
jgi:Protein of unknown function (DUF3347)